MIKPCDLVFSRLGIEKGCSENEIRTAVDAASRMQGIPLSSESARTILQKILSQNECEDIEIAEPMQTSKAWRYFTLNVNGKSETEVLIAPEDGLDAATLPPTDAESIILNAWASGRVAELEKFKNRVLVFAGWATHSAPRRTRHCFSRCSAPFLMPPRLL